MHCVPTAVRFEGGGRTLAGAGLVELVLGVEGERRCAHADQSACRAKRRGSTACLNIPGVIQAATEALLRVLQ